MTAAADGERRVGALLAGNVRVDHLHDGYVDVYPHGVVDDEREKGEEGDDVAHLEDAARVAQVLFPLRLGLVDGWWPAQH